ncbi:MAG: NAD(P)H-dependent oxidoreductase subunit E [Spirochaetales bacterium]|nr:NAD(P)H-dependent oxidoreductase subunit E [Spirochaetales bacterium]
MAETKGRPGNPFAMENSAISEILGKWKNKQSPLLMTLHEIQKNRGYISRESTLEISEALDIPLARIYEVLTFNNYFKLSPPGDVVISVCTGTACHLKGSGQLLKKLEKVLGIHIGETTSDGRFHLQYVRCIGCCSLAPALVINGKVYSKVDPLQIKQILAEWQGEARESVDEL